MTLSKWESLAIFARFPPFYQLISYLGKDLIYYQLLDKRELNKESGSQEPTSSPSELLLSQSHPYCATPVPTALGKPDLTDCFHA